MVPVLPPPLAGLRDPRAPGFLLRLGHLEARLSLAGPEAPPHLLDQQALVRRQDLVAPEPLAGRPDREDRQGLLNLQVREDQEGLADQGQDYCIPTMRTRSNREVR